MVTVQYNTIQYSKVKYSATDVMKCVQIHCNAMIITMIIIIIIIITAYTAAFPQSGSSSAQIQVISTSDTGQATSTREIALLFLRSSFCGSTAGQ